MNTKISVGLEGMRFYAYHGFYEEERKVGRNFEVDVKLDVFTNYDGADELDGTLNYESIYKIVKEEMSQSQKLIETVGYNIKKRLIEISTYKILGYVRIRKIRPLMGGEVGSSVIEIYI